EIMKITATDLLANHIIDDIVVEPLGGAHRAPEEAAQLLESYLITQLNELKGIGEDELVDQRYNRFRKYGAFFE
ncbi:MAG: acetyl-CoA carboxylase carboxyl transferase subunit alpha, partial [Niameybacter sp.]